MRIAIDIGVCGDLCTFVEVIRGRYAKRIMYTDGEMSWTYVKQIDWDAPVDVLIEKFIHDGFFMPVADGFGALLDMYAELV